MCMDVLWIFMPSLSVYSTGILSWERVIFSYTVSDHMYVCMYNSLMPLNS